MLQNLRGETLDRKGDRAPADYGCQYGLGGRDFMPDQAEYVLDELVEIAKNGDVRTVKEYIGVKE